jgi:hypothetical protein
LTAGFIEGLNIESSDCLAALWSFIAANGLKAIEDARLHFLLGDALGRTTQAIQTCDKGVSRVLLNSLHRREGKAQIFCSCLTDFDPGSDIRSTGCGGSIRGFD